MKKTGTIIIIISIAIPIIMGVFLKIRSNYYLSKMTTTSECVETQIDGSIKSVSQLERPKEEVLKLMVESILCFFLSLTIGFILFVVGLVITIIGFTRKKKEDNEFMSLSDDSPPDSSHSQ